MSVPDLQSAFGAGEISPELYGQVALKKYSSAATTMRNMFPNYRGGAISRGGLAFVGRCLQSTAPSGGASASGYIIFAANPSPGDTITLNGSLWTFVASGAGANQFDIQGSLAVTLAFEVRTKLNASTDPLIDVATYNIATMGGSTANTLTIAYTLPGLVGNTYTLAASAGGTPSGANLTGGMDPTSLGNAPRPVPFQFSITQGYILEFGEQYMRFVFQGGYIVESPVAITGITRANPAVVSVSGTPFSNTDWVFINGVQGMTPINGTSYIVELASSGHFALLDLNGHSVDSTSFPTYTGGGTASRIYTIATPYHVGDLPYLKFAQSADVMQLTCSNPLTGAEYPPYTLSRLAADNWTLAASDFDSVVDPPGGVAASANVAAPTSGINATFDYVVTAVDSKGNESIASLIASCNGADIEVEGGSNTITWDAVTGSTNPISFYNIYRSPASVNNGMSAIAVPAGSFFGLVGSAFGNSFTDTQQSPDLTQTPPLFNNPFSPGKILAIDVVTPGSSFVPSGTGYTLTLATGADFSATPIVNGGELGAVLVVDGGHGYSASTTIAFTGSGTVPTGNVIVGPQSGTYPGVCNYFQQRLFFANSLNDPDTFWATRTGLFGSFNYTIPTVATDAITASPWSEQVNGIQWLISMPGGLIAMTGLRAWQINGEGGSGLNPQPITPGGTQAQPQAFNGCSATIPPVVIDYDVLYVQSIGNSTVFDLAWNFWVNIYTGNDLTILSSHLFFGRQIIQWAWARQPYKVLWACCDDGTLLSLTYLKEQEVYGWARHDTSLGLVAGIASVSEPPVNAVYCVVQRPNSNYPFGIYTMERMDDRIWASTEDPYCVDSGVSNPMVFPEAPITGSTLSGAVTFTAQLNIFSANSVGQVIRMGGGIATIGAYVSPTTVTGTWVLAGTASPLGVPYAAAGAWSIATPVAILQGALHLHGLGNLVALADGVPLTGLTADSGGIIALTVEASDVKVGLSFLPQLQTPYLNGQEAAQGARKIIPAASLRLAASGSGFQVGTNQPDGAAQNPPQLGPTWMNMQQQSTIKPTGGQAPAMTYTTPGGLTAAALWTGDIRVVGKGSEWNSKGQVAIQQTFPLPLEVLAIMPEVLPGDIPEVTYKPEPKPMIGGRETPRGPGLWQVGGR